MYIESVPNRKSPPAILLREGKRIGKKVVKRTLANLTHWPEHVVEGLRTLLKGGVALGKDDPRFSITRTLALPFTHKSRHSESPGGHMQGALLKQWLFHCKRAQRSRWPPGDSPEGNPCTRVIPALRRLPMEPPLAAHRALV